VLESVFYVVLFSAPTGELVPAKMVLQPDGEYKVEYSSRFTGKFSVFAFYTEQTPIFLNLFRIFFISNTYWKTFY